MSVKKILGLDLGTSSIGWAVIETDEKERHQILDMGVRIIPLSVDDAKEFNSGNAITKNQKRTQKRTQRKGYDRYQLRRKNLTETLLAKDMFDATLFKLKPLELWGLRAKAVTEKVELKELGRILYHLNQKRGYKSSRSEANADKKETEYVAEVKNRHQLLKEAGLTIGQKFFRELSANQYYRIRQQVFPREAYIEEFDAIMNEQRKHHPAVLTDEFIDQLKYEIIYYQRPLKSQKRLVSICEFEKHFAKNNEGKVVESGPKVAPKSSPLFQVCKIWESINNITIKNKFGEDYIITPEQKQLLFEYLDTHEKLTTNELLKLLKLNKNDGWYCNKQLDRGLQGNITKVAIAKVLGKESPLLQFNLHIECDEHEEAFLVDRATGEILSSKQRKYLNSGFENEPLYQLWHTIYSISDMDDCTRALTSRFGLEQKQAEELARIDFTRFGFGNKSARAMRKILPYLMEGDIYSNACSYAGYNHSSSLTKDENLRRQLLEAIPNLPKNSLRQPIVEKILNQMINVVNAIIKTYGRPDEIRVELARELKQSKEERNETFSRIRKIERENEAIRKRIQEEYHLRATRNNVIKWRLFHEINNADSKINAVCIYCGKSFGLRDALSGDNVDVEHIIPKSLLFDDSQSNKTLSHRSCNEEKGNKTAFDYMSTKSTKEFEDYIERVNNLYKDKIISKAKRDKLLMPESKIPKDFIDRQLRESQYIAKKSKEILEQVCRNVWSTSGSVTEYLRRVWGWDDVLMNMQLPKYRELGLTETIEIVTSNEQKHQKEVIKGWSKRDDHRHHAIDALVIACTKQGFIQRINNLSAQGNRDEMYAEAGAQGKGSLLEKYLAGKRIFAPHEVANVASKILVSFKAGKKVATLGKRKIRINGKTVVAQEGIIVPRGALSEESVYGRIKALDRDLKTHQAVKHPLKYIFEHPDRIVKDYIRQLVLERLQAHDNDVKKALASVKKDPIYLDEEKTKLLEYASCYKEEYVIKYPLESIKATDVDYIIDGKVRELVRERLRIFGNKEKEAYKSPLYLNEQKGIVIRTVRMFTGLNSVEPVKRDEEGRPIGYVKPGNNHHIAFYKDEQGKVVEHCCTFWHATERKRFGLPAIIKQPKEVWETIGLKELPQNFLAKLPLPTWTYLMDFQQNESFLLGLVDSPERLRNTDTKNLSDYLYVVWSISEKDYWLKHHLETKNSELKNIPFAREAKRCYRFTSIKSFLEMNPIKVRISNLGKITFP